jgi:hypothetical protein
MALLTLQVVADEGDIVWENAAAGGDEFENDGRNIIFWTQNNSGGPITVTFTGQRVCIHNVIHDHVVNVADGVTDQQQVFNDHYRFNTLPGRVEVGYSGVSSVQVAVTRPLTG